jgi:hypothetical protein
VAQLASFAEQNHPASAYFRRKNFFCASRVRGWSHWLTRKVWERHSDRKSLRLLSWFPGHKLLVILLQRMEHMRGNIISTAIRRTTRPFILCRTSFGFHPYNNYYFNEQPA